MPDNEEFDLWLEKQDEPTKNLIANRFSKLEATVKATREERDGFSKSIKELMGKAEKGSEIEKSLLEMTEKAKNSEKRAIFMEKAVSEGCLRPGVAFQVAVSDGLFDEQGEPDFKKLKTSIPELFKVVNSNTHAGAGTQQPVLKSSDPIGDAIRNRIGK
jgi:hypothetical protein